MENIAYELNKRKKQLPVIKEDIPLILAGGLSLATGFTEKVSDTILRLDFPLNIGDIRRASEPMTTVSHGCLLASHL